MFFIKSIGLDFLFKVFALILSFIQVPLLISVLGKDIYGFWIILFSIIQWMILFDFGIGNGLRNIIPKLLSSGNGDKISSYLFTSFCLLVLISLTGLGLSFYLIEYFDFTWFGLANEPHWFVGMLYTFAILFYIFLLLSIIKPLVYIIHKPYLVSFMSLVQSIFVLLTILIFKDSSISVGNLMMTLLVTCIVANVLSSIIIFFYFKKYYSYLFNGVFYFSKHALKDVLSKSSDLFFLQLVFLGTYCIDNFMVANYYSSEGVTEYSIAVKVYSMYTFMIGIIISPLWNRLLDFLNNNKEFEAVNLVSMYLKIFLFSVPILLFSVLFVDYIIELWVGKDVVSNISYLPFALFYMTLGLGMINSAVLNAMEIIKIQWTLGLIVVILKVSLFPLYINFMDISQPSDLMWFSFLLLFPVTIVMFFIMHIKLKNIVHQ
tara:strand:- start:1636 stop:2931 length:1296 start_codon:yes stop_codon:yes gene_type:complete